MPSVNVTCLCPTYGRFERLRDAVACFIMQTHPHRTLMILNDAPVPIDAGNVPVDDGEVIVMNEPERYPTLGEKRQALLELATTEVVAHWDDDDLYLPWHLQALMSQYRKSEAKCVKPANAWWLCGPRGLWDLKGPKHNQFEGQMLFSRKRAMQPFTWTKHGEEKTAPGGYPPLISGQAAHLMGKFKSVGSFHTWKARPADISYLYRWRDTVHHISAERDKQLSHEKFARVNHDFGSEPLIPDGNPYDWARARMRPQFDELALAMKDRMPPADMERWLQRMGAYLGEYNADVYRSDADGAGAVQRGGKPPRLAALPAPPA